MLITDHITTAVPNPLIGENIDELGTRFPDMSEVYAPELQEKVRKAAEKLQVPLQEGVYMQFTGPSYETPAEIRMCRTWGGDAAGMSTACEAVAANHMGMKVCGISCITNLAAGMSKQKLDHAKYVRRRFFESKRAQVRDITKLFCLLIIFGCHMQQNMRKNTAHACVSNVAALI